MKHYRRLLILFLIILFLFNLSDKVRAQDLESEIARSLQVSVSNNKPDINEVVTIKAICIAPMDLPKANVYFHLYEDGIELVSGEKRWDGSLKKGEKIVREIKVKFTEKKVYHPLVYFTLKNLNSMIKFYVEGAVEDSWEVENIKRLIKNLERAINNPDIQSRNNYILSMEFPEMPKDSVSGINGAKPDTIFFRLLKKYNLLKGKAYKLLPKPYNGPYLLHK